MCYCCVPILQMRKVGPGGNALCPKREEIWVTGHGLGIVHGISNCTSYVRLSFCLVDPQSCKPKQWRSGSLAPFAPTTCLKKGSHSVLVVWQSWCGSLGSQEIKPVLTLLISASWTFFITPSAFKGNKQANKEIKNSLVLCSLPLPSFFSLVSANVIPRTMCSCRVRVWLIYSISDQDNVEYCFIMQRFQEWYNTDLFWRLLFFFLTLLL